MISIFYQKQTIGDVLLITINGKQNSENLTIKNEKNFTLITNENELIGINILKFSKFLKIENGFIYPTSEIIEKIFEITKIDLKPYLEKKFIVSEIKKCEKITNTHLTKCLINSGDEFIELICGANNVKVNEKVVLVKNNAFLPNGVLIQPTKIQNVLSKGMLCSFKELNINIDKNGIIILDKNENIGNEYLKHFSNLRN